MKRILFLTALLAAVLPCGSQAPDFRLNDSGYFNRDGVDVMAFNDFYPEGHQGGISVLMHGHRIASNGDIRFEPTPGQWQPVPKQLNRRVEADRIVTTLCYPDSSRHFTGFNPMIYPDVQLSYTVTLEPSGKGFLVTVDLDSPVPEVLAGRAGFNLEFFPGALFGKPWIMDGHQGIFPPQPNAPLLTQESYVYRSVGDFRPANAPDTDIKHLIGEGYSPFTADAVIAEPYAGRPVQPPDDPERGRGRAETLRRPDEPQQRLVRPPLGHPRGRDAEGRAMVHRAQRGPRMDRQTGRTDFAGGLPARCAQGRHHRVRSA